MKTIKQLIERLDTEIEMVCCDSARVDWQTLKTAVLAQQTTNSAMVPCHHWKKDWPICGLGFKSHCIDKPCLLAQHQ